MNKINRKRKRRHYIHFSILNCDTKKSFMDIYQAAVQLAYYGPIVLFSIGIPGAIFNVILFIVIKTFRKSPISYYVISQSFADIIALLIVLLQTIPSTTASTSSISCKSLVFIAQFIVPCAMSYLCLIAFDRWACTSPSARIRRLNSTYVARYLFLLPFILCPVCSIPFFIYVDLVPPLYTCGSTNELFTKIALYFLNPILGNILPLLILTLFGLLTCRNIRLVIRVRQQPVRNRLSMWEQQMTRMMLTQTLLSASCTLPRAIFTLYTIATYKGSATRNFNKIVIDLLLDSLTYVILCVNFASSFYIFIFSSPRVRQTITMHLKQMLGLRSNQIDSVAIHFTAPAITTLQTVRDNGNLHITTVQL